MKGRSLYPPLPVLLERYPEVRAWLEGGLPLVQALALRRAGILDPSGLAGITRERFLQLPGVGLTTLRHCERIAGKPFPSGRESVDVDLERDARTVLTAQQWRTLGFGTITARTFARWQLTLERLRRMDRSQILAMRGVGAKSLEVWRNLFGGGKK